MKRNEKVICADGFSMSVQAHAGAYCLPRMTGAPIYREVEVGHPSAEESMLMDWAEDALHPTDTVYGWVPVKVVTNVIAKHGGIVSGAVPPGVIELRV
mgnify:FL=1|jgi:hypothetical protein|tara:strand:- start:1671 stop:1964 length:294 start_codon:yes stop_codon:yes gene_type:complete